MHLEPRCDDSQGVLRPNTIVSSGTTTDASGDGDGDREAEATLGEEGAAFGVAATGEVLVGGVDGAAVAVGAAGLTAAGGACAADGDDAGTRNENGNAWSGEEGVAPGVADAGEVLACGVDAVPAAAWAATPPDAWKCTNNTTARSVTAVVARIISASRHSRLGSRLASRCEPDILLTVPTDNTGSTTCEPIVARSAAATALDLL
ncbi:MAG: hypothetical protein ACXVGB_03030 [Mycobacteriaceae bacterium]